MLSFKKKKKKNRKPGQRPRPPVCYWYHRSTRKIKGKGKAVNSAGFLCAAEPSVFWLGVGSMDRGAGEGERKRWWQSNDLRAYSLGAAPSGVWRQSLLSCFRHPLLRATFPQMSAPEKVNKTVRFHQLQPINLTRLPRRSRLHCLWP